MLVVKQCSIDVKTLTKLQILITFLITDLSQIAARISQSSSINVVKDGIINLPENEDNFPSQFPESRHDQNSTHGTPIVVLRGTLLNDSDKTAIDNIKRAIGDIGKDKLPTEVTVILTNNDTYADTHVNNVNLNTPVKSLNDSIATEQKRNQLLMKKRLSKRSTIIFVVAVTLVSILFYVLLVSLRKILERKYGDRELLMQSESEVKNENYFQDRVV